MRMVRIRRLAGQVDHDDAEESTNFLRNAGITLLALGVAAAAAAVVVRVQVTRHRRDLFSPQPLQRLAALGYIAALEPSVDVARLLVDYMAWEPRSLLRRRAGHILERIERKLIEDSMSGESAG